MLFGARWSWLETNTTAGTECKPSKGEGRRHPGHLPGEEESGNRFPPSAAQLECGLCSMLWAALLRVLSNVD